MGAFVAASAGIVLMSWRLTYAWIGSNGMGERALTICRGPLANEGITVVLRNTYRERESHWGGKSVRNEESSEKNESGDANHDLMLIKV